MTGAYTSILLRGLRHVEISVHEICLAPNLDAQPMDARGVLLREVWPLRIAHPFPCTHGRHGEMLQQPSCQWVSTVSWRVGTRNVDNSN